jgi:hypothetical protein
MCGIHDHDFQRPLHQLDVLDVSKYYQLPFDFCQHIFEAMTDWENPELASYILVIEALKRFQEKDFGINQDFGPWIPLSAISLDDKFIRYRTPAMQVFHDAFIAFNMSERNRDILDTVLTKQQMKLVTLHSCGIVIVPVEKYDEFMNCKLHKVRNKLRSRANPIGTLLVLVDGFEDIPCQTDIGKSEFQSYFRAWKLLTTIPIRNVDTSIDLSADLNYLRSNLHTKLPVS